MLIVVHVKRLLLESNVSGTLKRKFVNLFLLHQKLLHITHVLVEEVKYLIFIYFFGDVFVCIQAWKHKLDQKKNWTLCEYKIIKILTYRHTYLTYVVRLQYLNGFASISKTASKKADFCENRKLSCLSI